MKTLAVRCQEFSLKNSYDIKELEILHKEILKEKDAKQLMAIITMPLIDDSFRISAKIALFYVQDFPEVSKGQKIQKTSRYKIHKSLLPKELWEIVNSNEQHDVPEFNVKVRVKGDYLFFFEDSDLAPEDFFGIVGKDWFKPLLN